MRRALTCGLLAALLLPAACGGAQPPGSSGCRVTVFAAQSLTGSFEALERAFEKRNPKVPVEISFGHSPSQVTALAQGAPAGVLATASTVPMQQAVRRNLLTTTPKPFARNTLAIVVPARNPSGIMALADLANPQLTVLLPAPKVPAGRLAQQALRNAGVDVEADSFTRGVKPVVTKVAIGEADAGIVYRTDVRAGGPRVEGVAIAPQNNVVAGYPIAVTRTSDCPNGASRFVAFVRSPRGQAIMQRFGFLPATPKGGPGGS